MTDLLAAQQARIDQLAERVRQLEDELMPPLCLPIEWALTSTEARLFAHLTTREIATKQSLMVALYSDRYDANVDPKIVDVFICKIRKKLSPFGIRIETIWAQGYRLHDRQKFIRSKSEDGSHNRCMARGCEA